MRITVALALVLLFAAPAFASETCAPIDNSARILKSPSPNDTHPDWVGESYIGTDWQFDAIKTVRSDTGEYLLGDLVSPRGGHVTKRSYVLAKEWVCH